MNDVLTRIVAMLVLSTAAHAADIGDVHPPKVRVRVAINEPVDLANYRDVRVRLRNKSPESAVFIWAAYPGSEVAIDRWRGTVRVAPRFDHASTDIKAVDASLDDAPFGGVTEISTFMRIVAVEGHSTLRVAGSVRFTMDSPFIYCVAKDVAVQRWQEGTHELRSRLTPAAGMLNIGTRADRVLAQTETIPVVRLIGARCREIRVNWSPIMAP